VTDLPGRIRPTRLRTLAAVAAGGLVVGWFGVPLLREVDGTVPTIPWVSVLALLFAGAVLVGMAWQTWTQLHRRHQRIDPHRAVNFLVLAKASAIVGAAVAGVYLGYAAQYLDGLGYDAPTSRVLRGAAGTVAGVLIVVGGLVLERACIVPGLGRRDREGRGAGDQEGRGGNGESSDEHSESERDA
jgi:Protein of unknown function (DUF3180)